MINIFMDSDVDWIIDYVGDDVEEHEMLRNSHYINEPERRLFAAVLRLAVTDILSPYASSEDRRLAFNWVMGKSDSDLAFDYVCGALGVSEIGVRNLILREVTAGGD